MAAGGKTKMKEMKTSQLMAKKRGSEIMAENKAEKCGGDIEKRHRKSVTKNDGM